MPGSVSGPAFQRLAATGQMLNASGPVTAQRALARQLAGGAVVQAKLFKDRAEIPKETEGASPIVRHLLDSDRDYVMRGNCQPADATVHIIDRGRKYLLGEQHGTTAWAERTADWDVDTMVESGKGFPESPTVHVGEGPRTGQDLESIHAYTVAVALQWRKAYNLWLGAWLNWIKIRHTDSQATKETKEFTEHPGAELENWAMEFLKLFEHYKQNEDKYAGNTNAKLIRENVPIFEQALTQMMDTITDIQFEENDDQRETMLKTKLGKFDTVIHNIAFVFTAATGRAENRPEIRARAKGLVPIGKDEETGLTNPAREAQMIHNITAARAPLFVKIGDRHVGRVQAGVAGSVAVPFGADFAEMTRATEGHMPAV